MRNSIVTDIFTKNRLNDILKFLHFADNDELDPHDKFGSVNPLLKMVNENYANNIILEWNVSIDESMIPYYGRHGCKQYIQNKSVKFGYKLWVTVTPLGYAIQFYQYAGRYRYYNKDIGLEGFVVIKLMTQFPKTSHSNYHVKMDNFFTTSPTL
ncbi:unnamed protein product [Lepeophtheirus salmonis]|uniref:(salmon louse) hypothetical protein n=1 Tax=Lepeophtheirus salmonis TaxID=72036 RepID=A0A7R8H3K2_LEPSM|nr:unnamed protein product [Lepeophtheirus salmonis]CAF2845393.1 unnamed protein product [Lepeophtheirus salmonis]